jgi:hypothetical protein
MSRASPRGSCGTRLPHHLHDFDAILALHRGSPAGAVAALAEDPETLTQWHTGAWRQWYAALRAEAAVLASAAGGVSAHGAHDLTKRLQRTRDIVTGNPIASAIVDRTAACASGWRAGIPSSRLSSPAEG